MSDRGAIEYASPASTPPSRRLPVPAWLAVASLLLPLLLLAAVHGELWKVVNRFHFMGQAWERWTGILWIVTASLSILWVAAFVVTRPKRWLVWVCLAVHVTVLATTLCWPGPFLIPWLMHWLHGPGA
jgi:hypothetical protein